MIDLNPINNFLDQFQESKREKMLSVYLSTLEKKAKQCIEAYNAKDSSELRLAAHDLKSLSYTLNIKTSGDLARLIEESIVNDDTDTAFNNVEELIGNIEQLITVMKTHPLHHTN